MRRKYRSAHPGILSPQLPPQLLVGDASTTNMQDGATYTKLSLANCDFSEQAATDVLLDQVYFKRVSLSQTQLTAPQVIDSRLEACDFAGAEWEKAYFRRIELLGCRLVGAKLIQANIEDVVIKDCNGELALFWESSFKAVRFERSTLREASFEGANLSGVVFDTCDLQKADLRNTKLVGTDFRGSMLSGIQVGIKELQGAIIDPAQAVQLADLLGMTVRTADE